MLTFSIWAGLSLDVKTLKIKHLNFPGCWRLYFSQVIYCNTSLNNLREAAMNYWTFLSDSLLAYVPANPTVYVRSVLVPSVTCHASFSSNTVDANGPICVNGPRSQLALCCCWWLLKLLSEELHWCNLWTDPILCSFLWVTSIMNPGLHHLWKDEYGSQTLLLSVLLWFSIFLFFFL